jgi:hypothetical protein
MVLFARGMITFLNRPMMEKKASETDRRKERGMQQYFCWQRPHWPEYGAELLGTAFLVFIAISAVTLTFGSGSPLAAVLPNSSARRLIAGLILATSGPLVALSPLGKLSGAHLNPALSLAFWLLLSSHRLMRWTPLMSWLLVAFIYWLVAPISGSSLNPARSFGPALVSWFWRDQWVYVLASPLGALLAVGLFRVLNGVGIHDVLTPKLFHAPRYRCIFKHVNAPQVNTDQDGRLVAPRERD